MTKVHNQFKYTLETGGDLPRAIQERPDNLMSGHSVAIGQYLPTYTHKTVPYPVVSEKIWLDPKTSKKDKLKVCSKALHPEFSYPLIEVAEMSLEKGYKPLNWLDPDNKVTVMYLIEAAQRHLDKVKMGIDINNEEKKLGGSQTINQPYHAAQVAYNMLMLCRQIQEGMEIDDRLFKDGVRK